VSKDNDLNENFLFIEDFQFLFLNYQCKKNIIINLSLFNNVEIDFILSKTISHVIKNDFHMSGWKSLNNNLSFSSIDKKIKIDILLGKIFFIENEIKPLEEIITSSYDYKGNF
jgi:hypothetical protein